LDNIATKQMRGHDYSQTEKPKRCKPALQIAREVWQRQGIRGFYKGYFLTLMHNAPMSALVWGTYENLHPHTRKVANTLRNWVTSMMPGSREPRIVVDSAGHPHSLPNRLHPSLIKWDWVELVSVGISAGTAGAVASTCTLPLDVIKTRLQASRDPTATVRSTWRTLLAERGWAGLHSGLSARLASSVPTSALLMVCFEVLKRSIIGHHCLQPMGVKVINRLIGSTCVLPVLLYFALDSPSAPMLSLTSPHCSNRGTAENSSHSVRATQLQLRVEHTLRAISAVGFTIPARWNCLALLDLFSAMLENMSSSFLFAACSSARPLNCSTALSFCAAHCNP
jgi:hypothetical protein